MQPTIKTDKYSNGKIRVEASYVHGQIHGFRKFYSSIDGSINSKASYVHGKRHGFCIWRAHYYSIWYIDLNKAHKTQARFSISSKAYEKYNPLVSQDKLQTPLFSKSQFKKLCNQP